MPVDFRTYNDPGVYVETINPPVIFNPTVEPTILAIVGKSPSAKTVRESLKLEHNILSPSLNTLGVQYNSINLIDKLSAQQYISSAIGTLTADIDDAAVAAGFTLFSGISWDTMVAVTDYFVYVQIDDEIIKVTVSDATASTLTIARGQLSTVAAAHTAGSVVNYYYRENFPSAGYQDPFVIGRLYQATSNTATSMRLDTSEGNSYTLAHDGTGVTYDLELGAQSATLAFGADEAAIDTAISGMLTALGYTNVVVDVQADNTTDGVADGVRIRMSAAEPITQTLTADFTNLTGQTYALLVANGVCAPNTPTAGGFTNWPVAKWQYLEAEGERMLVTAVANGSSTVQTLTVTRGVQGTTAKNHGTVLVSSNSGGDYLVYGDRGDDLTAGTVDDEAQLKILDTTRMADNTYVNIWVKSIDSVQYVPALFDDMDTVRDKYGDPIVDGAINSELSLAAQIAFNNGATQLVLVAAENGPSADVDDLLAALASLEYETSINVITVISDSVNENQIITAVQSHVNNMSDQGYLRRAFVGLDGVTSATVSAASFINKATELSDMRVTLVSPSNINIKDPDDSSKLIKLPGAYVAAAVAGLHAGLPVQEPLTRKQLSGFASVNDAFTSSDLFSMQSNGVLVASLDRSARLIIKHGLTTDISTVYNKEISVIAARDKLRDLIYDTLDNGALIGTPMTARTPDLVISGVTGALEEALLNELIFDYSDVKYRVPSDNPTAIEVRFAYKPTLPLNYIHVQFSIDTSNAFIQFTAVDEETNNFV